MSRNYGWGSREIGKAVHFALKNAVESKTLSYSSAATLESRFSQFATYIREEFGVKDLQYITAEMVMEYAEYLQEKVQADAMSIATAHNYVSAINSIMDICTRGEWQPITAVSDCGFESRSHVRTEAPPSREEAHAIADKIEERLGQDAGIVIRLATELGLRAREASLLRPADALRQAERTGAIRVAAGTKGGRPREVPVVRDEQRALLERAAEAWGQHNAIEASGYDSWKTYQDGFLREVRDQMRDEGHRLHDLRACYACERYLELTGSAPPVWGGEPWGSAGEDNLQQIADELGHGRADVLAAYLGART